MLALRAEAPQKNQKSNALPGLLNSGHYSLAIRLTEVCQLSRDLNLLISIHIVVWWLQTAVYAGADPGGFPQSSGNRSNFYACNPRVAVNKQSTVTN